MVTAPINAVVGGVSKAAKPILHEAGHVVETGIKAVSSTVQAGEHVVSSAIGGAEHTVDHVFSPIGRGLGSGINHLGMGLHSIGTGVGEGVHAWGDGMGEASAVLPWALGGVAIAYLLLEGNDESPAKRRKL